MNSPSCLMVAKSGHYEHVINWARAAAVTSDVTAVAFGTKIPSDWSRITDTIAVSEIHGIRCLFVRDRPLRPSRVFWPLNNLRKTRTLEKAIEMVPEIQKPDIIQGHWYPVAAPLITLAHRLGGKYIHTEHSTRLLDPTRTPSRGGYSSLRRLVEGADALIVVGDELAGYYQGAGRESVHILPNPIDAAVYTISAPPTPGDEIRLVTIGRLEKAKQHDVLLRMLSELKETSDISFSLSVLGQGSLGTRLTALRDALGLREAVKFLGQQDRAVVAAILADSHLYIHSANVETFSMAIAEAQLSGLPVVAYRSGGLTESLAKWQGEGVALDEPSGLMNALLTAIDRLGDYDRNEIARHAREHYSIESVGQQLGRVFRSVMTR